jgi:hypothetical protein
VTVVAVQTVGPRDDPNPVEAELGIEGEKKVVVA